MERLTIRIILLSKPIHNLEPSSFKGFGLKRVWLNEGFNCNHTNMKLIFNKFFDSVE